MQSYYISGAGGAPADRSQESHSGLGMISSQAKETGRIVNQLRDASTIGSSTGWQSTQKD